jgi:hypothetical protein
VSAAHRIAIAALLPLLLVGCGKEDEKEKAVQPEASVSAAKFSARDSTRKLGAGDVQIVSADSAVELAIIGDSIIGGLGKKVLDKVRQDTDTAKTTEKGFGAAIANAVKSSVASALSHQIIFPVAEVQDVRYENGSIQMYGNGGGKLHIFENSTGDKSKNEKTAFTEADAQRFIAAFHARKAAMKS